MSVGSSPRSLIITAFGQLSKLAAAASRSQQQQQVAASPWTASIAAAAAAAQRAFTAAAAAPHPSPAKRLGLAEVKHIIAVASGKGGVGKSTVAGGFH